MKNQFKEIEIADEFSSLLTINQKRNFIESLPERINIGKVLRNLKSDNDKVEFVKLFLNKEPFYYKFIRNYKKEKNNTLKKLSYYKNDYKRVRGVLNGLRKNNKVLLKDEAVKTMERRKKYKSFYDSIFKAEAFADLIKENNYNGDLLNKLLAKNNELISNDRLFFENLKDIFEFDGNLNNLSDDFNKYLIDNVENNRSAKEIILNAEERILSGDISNIYNEIEKTEKLLSQNISQILLNIYNSIDVMDSKKSFVNYIEEIESANISDKDINFLRTKSNEYRNIELPNKWNEMKHKLKFTENINHFAAWYYGLQQGIYRNVVANVKEYIVIEIIKIVLYNINEKYADQKINTLNLMNLMQGKDKEIGNIKSAFKNFFNKDDVRKLKDEELFIQLENYFVYFIYLNYDLNEESDLLEDLFIRLKENREIVEKVKFLEKTKDKFNSKNSDERFKKHINGIFANIIELYRILNNKQIVREEKVKPDFDEQAGSEAIIFLNKLYDDHQKNRENDIAAKIMSLPHDKDIEVISILKFDPRFEEFYPEVEETLYHKDWGRTLGVIVYKVKDIENRFGALTSEDYLSDLEERFKFKFGENSFIVRKIRNMKINLELLHKEGTKKLHYLKEKLTRAKSSANKIIELQRISKDSRFKGIFGTIKNMERILVRDKFEEIYEKVQKLPVDTQMVLFQGIKDDLKSLLKYEPEIVKKVMDYIDGIDRDVLSAKKKISRIDDMLIENIDKFEKKELPLSDIADLMNIEMPVKYFYQKNSIEESIHNIKNDVNNGIKNIEDLDGMIEEINNDLSLFKIDESDESRILLNNAENLLSEIDKNIESAEKLDELKNAKSMKDIVLDIFENDDEKLIDKIDKLDTVFNSKNYDFEEKAKGFIISSKKVKDQNSRTKLNEIVEVIRRIEKEVEPLSNLESRVNKLIQWIESDYKNRDHIVEFLKKQIKEMGLKIGREGGLLRQLMDGLEQAKNKTGYLKEMMLKFEYQHLIPVIKALLDNINEEKKIREEDINEDMIDKILNGISGDEKKLSWLKVRKYWDKYEKNQDYIEKNINRCLKKGREDEEIYQNIIELAERVLELKSCGERQSFIKSQMDNDKDADNLLTSQRKLLFYLMSSDTDVPRDRVKALSQRVTLTSQEKQKYLQLLKKTGSDNKGLLIDKLNITDEDIAYYSLMILYPEKSVDIRIKYLGRFKSSDDEKINQYKAAFDITDKIIDNVINDLKKKSSKKEQNIPEIIEIEKSGQEIPETLEEKNRDVLIKKEKTDEDFKKIEAIMNKDQTIEKTDEQSTEQGIQDVNILGNVTFDGISEIKEDNENPDMGAISAQGENSENQAESKKKKLEFTDNADMGFTEEELKKLTESGDKAKIDRKSTKEIINEQKFRDEFKKREERFNEEKVNKIQNRILSLGEKSKEVIVQNIQKKARQIYEDKHKRIEDKITDIISYLTTCYTEAITKIIEEEILPVFKEEGVNLNAYNMLSSINNSVFKPVLQNRDVEDNIKFLEKTLSKNNIDNIRIIVEKLKILWKSVEKQIQKEHEDFENAIYDINQGRGVSSILIYLDNLEADDIIKEIDDNLLVKIQNEKVKSDLLIIRNNFISVYNKGILKDEKELIFEKLNLNKKYQDIFNELVEKIKLSSFDSPGEVEKKDIYVDNSVTFSEKEKKLEEKTDIKEKNIKEKEKGKIIEKSEDSFQSAQIPKVIEEELAKANRFIKPHLYIVDLSKMHGISGLDDVIARKKIIESLYNKGRIFTYDGSTYVGEGQITNLVKNELIPKFDRSKFVDRLDNFLNRFLSKQEIFHFLGVQNEMEFRRLNFLLDKYNVNRSGSKFTMYMNDEEAAEKNKQEETVKKQRSLREEIKDNTDIKTSDKEIKQVNKKSAEYIEKFKRKIKENDKKKAEKKKKIQNFLLNQKDFVNKNQRELLNMAKNEINNRLKNLIKSAVSKLDLDAIYKNYFGNNELNRRNMLNLCGNIKQISDIIRKDTVLFNKISFDREKLEKIFNDKYKKYK